MHGVLLSSVGQLLCFGSPRPSATMSSTSVSSIATTEPASSMDTMVNVGDAVVRMGHHVVGCVLTTTVAQQRLQPNDSGQDESNLADDQSLGGDHGDDSKSDLAHHGGFESDQGHERAHVASLLAALLATSETATISAASFLSLFFHQVTQGSGAGGNGVDQVAALDVYLDGVGVQEALQAAEEQRLDAVICKGRKRNINSTSGCAHLKDRHSWELLVEDRRI